MELKNMMIRKELFENNLSIRHLAKYLGRRESTVARLMKYELPIKAQVNIVRLIREHAGEERG